MTELPNFAADSYALPGRADPETWMQWNAADEEITPNEAAKQAALAAVIGRIQSRQFSNYSHYTRGSHAKSLGFVRGVLKIADSLPSHLRHGIFLTPGKSYEVGARYASESSHIQDDREQDVRGLGIKVFGVEGQAIGGGPASTQDLLFNSCPTSELATLDTAFEVFTLRENYWDDPAALRDAFLARPDAHKLLAPSAQPNVHVASSTMYTQTAYRFGPFICKLSLLPTSRPQMALRNGRRLPPTADFMAHHKLLRTYFHNYPATYDLRAQFASDPDQHPIEDASVLWDEPMAPWITLGELCFPVQESFSDARRVWWEDKVALTPWNGLEDHQPLGSLGRARRAAYELSRRKRAAGNVVDASLAVKIENMPA